MPLVPDHYLGLMSGTSVDAVDAALVRIAPGTNRTELIAARNEPISESLRNRIIALTQPGDSEIDRLGQLDVEIGRLFAQAAIAVMTDAGMSAGQIVAIGSHGQTVRHRATGTDVPFTLQIGDPNTIAELTGITTVADFRRRDIAAGGQGAPLVPAFHAAMFRTRTTDRVVANIGGMANITVLPAHETAQVRGFDTGPGNVLLDAWHERHRGTPVDIDGNWARSGHISEPLLALLMRDPFLQQEPPKSTGREQFSPAWLDGRLREYGQVVAPHDIQATLTEFTALSLATAITQWGCPAGELFLCGGGAHNGYLVERLAVALPAYRVRSTAELGIAPDWVEAMAFAWLAQRTLQGLAGNLPAVTGARHPVVLGGIYPGNRAG